MNTLNDEPVAIAAIVRALLATVVAFGVGLSGEQVASVVVLVELVSAFAVRMRTRSRSSLKREGLGRYTEL